MATSHWTDTALSVGTIAAVIAFYIGAAVFDYDPTQVISNIAGYTLILVLPIATVVLTIIVIVQLLRPR